MENFNPASAARSIEQLGDQLLHKGRVPFEDIVAPMGELDPKQAKALISQLERDNFKPNGLPTVDTAVGTDGHIQGFTFKPAFSDTCATVTTIAVVSTGHHDSGVPPKSLAPAPHTHKHTEYLD